MLFAPFKLALKILGVVLAVGLIYIGVTFAQVWMTSHANDPHHADAILVFGTAANYLTPAPDLQARLERAVALYQAGLAPIIAVTGGKRAGDRYTEGQISAMWLEGSPNNVPKSAIIVGSGADSWDNVGSVAPELRSRSVRSVLVVTDGFHEDRAMAIASSYGFSPSPTPSQHSPIRGAAEVGYLIKESVEVAVGRIIGYGTLSNLDHS